MRNVQLIYSQNPEAQAIAGFKAWQNKFNRTVNKGENQLGSSPRLSRNLPQKIKLD